ncbi:MAG: hypothetical protein ACLFWB_11020 [Armatimonadota bacterium]
MISHPIFSYLPVLFIQALVLMFTSRLLFRGMVSAFGTNGTRGPLAFLRLPGNILHETSHAIGYLVFGYRVRHIVPCVFDPRGRGACVRGKPWSPVRFPWLADGFAAIMPLIAGTAALVYIGRQFGIIVPAPSSHLAQLTLAQHVIQQCSELLSNLDWHDWQTYLFLYLSLTIGAEISPSATDLRYAIPILLGLFAGVMVALYGAHHAEGLRELLISVADRLIPVMKGLFATWTVAAVLLLLTAAVAVPFTFVIHLLRPDRP